MVFAGPPEDDIDWADVSPIGAVKWLSRVWRLTGEVAGQCAGDPDAAVRRSVHRLVAEAMDDQRLNVAIARLMELPNVLRKAADSGPGLANPATREGVEALVRMLSCFAPFTAEEGWERLGHQPSVIAAGWPNADPALLVEETATCVVQINGKVRDRLEVSATIGEDELRELVLGTSKVRDLLGDSPISRIVVRAPKLVNIVSS
jgi:leucyl-tRNA synthetase